MNFPGPSSTSLCSPQPPSVMCAYLHEKQPFSHPLSDWAGSHARWRSLKHGLLLILPTTTKCFRVVRRYTYGQINCFMFPLLMSKLKFTRIQPILMIRLFISMILCWFERRVGYFVTNSSTFSGSNGDLVHYESSFCGIFSWMKFPQSWSFWLTE